MEFECKICHQKEETNNWTNGKILKEHQLCLECNHWRENHEADVEPYTYAIVDGGHYRLLPPTNFAFKGFGGRMFTFKFKDGTIRNCNNVWFQGKIPEGYWRDLMPDNAEII